MYRCENLAHLADENDSVPVSMMCPRIALQRHQIVERIHSIELTGMDQAHKQVPDLSPMQRPVNRSANESFSRSFENRPPAFSYSQALRGPVGARTGGRNLDENL